MPRINKSVKSGRQGGVRNPNTIHRIKKRGGKTVRRVRGDFWVIERRRLNPKTTGALGLKIRIKDESREVSGPANQIFNPTKTIYDRGLGQKRHAKNVNRKKIIRKREKRGVKRTGSVPNPPRRYSTFE